jgi:hypothetical protein
MVVMVKEREKLRIRVRPPECLPEDCDRDSERGPKSEHEFKDSIHRLVFFNARGMFA